MALLTGKVAIVTGAGSGIGAAIVETFHREGALVFAVDISGRQEEIAARLGAGCTPLRADVSIAHDFAAAISDTVQRAGRLDILVNNAGIDGQIALTADYDEDEFDRVMSVNAKSVFLGMKYAIPEMLKSGGGAIVNTASTASLVGFSQMPAYCASKGAVLMLTRTAALEYAQKGIRVNAICPGPTRTEMTKHLPADLIQQVVATTPIARYADPSELANSALFLASDLSSYVTGTYLAVDGAYMTA
jgi:NAD(P)-dependent dehydrogenase (short-subunit alcohol dehydrogenase family)